MTVLIGGLQASSWVAGSAGMPLPPALRASLAFKKALKSGLFSTLGVAALMWPTRTACNPTGKLD
jgi:hypothetical protein